MKAIVINLLLIVLIAAVIFLIVKTIQALRKVPELNARVDEMKDTVSGYADQADKLNETVDSAAAKWIAVKNKLAQLGLTPRKAGELGLTAFTVARFFRRRSKRNKRAAAK